MLPIQRRSAILGSLLVLAPAALSAQLTPGERAALDDLGPSYAGHYVLHRGWWDRRPVLYFDIGVSQLTSTPVYLFVTGFDGPRPVLVPGQRPVFGALPGQRAYSGIVDVHYIVVGAGYRANSVTSARRALGMMLRGEAREVVPGVMLNWPIVARGSTLEGDPTGRVTEAGWFEGSEVAYFDFGRTPLAPAPIYNFTTSFTGDLVRLDGQANVVPVAPDSNCPVVIVDGRPAIRAPLVPSVPPIAA